MEPLRKRFASSHAQSTPYHKHIQISQPNKEQFRALTVHSKCEHRSLQLITNAYSLYPKNQSLYFNKYSLTINPSKGFKNIPDRVYHRGFVSRSIRKLIIDKLIPSIPGSKDVESTVVINYGLDTLYTIHPLGDSKDLQSQPHSSKQTEIVFEKCHVNTDLLCHLYVDIILKYDNIYKIDSYQDSQELFTAVLHHQLQLDMIRYGANYFSQPNLLSPANDRLDLISQLAHGISLSSLRSCTASPNIVVISAPHAYLTQEYRLIDLLASFILERPIQGVQTSNSGSEKLVRIPEIDRLSPRDVLWESFNTILRGFKCKANNFGVDVNLRFEITSTSALETIIVNSDCEINTTVESFYRSKGILLSYPNLPCLISKSSQSFNYHPFEICTLIKGQKAPIFRLSSNASNHLIKLNKQRPQGSKLMSAEARDDIARLTRPHLESFGLVLTSDPIKAKSTTLEKPTLQFLDRSFEPERDFWESGVFYQAKHLVGNWCVVNTTEIDFRTEDIFFQQMVEYCRKFGFNVETPFYLHRSKQQLLDVSNCMRDLIEECLMRTNGNLSFVMFVIDSSSTQLNRLVHLYFDEHPYLTATCLRTESILNHRQRRSIFRTLVHKLNARLGGTNVTYSNPTLERIDLHCGDLMVIGLDVTHPDNELSGVSIVGCAYTYSTDLFRHKSLVWPQQARMEIIDKIDKLITSLMEEYETESDGKLPRHVIIFRDGVSHEEFDKVRSHEVERTQVVLNNIAEASSLPRPNLSYIIAQKRHTMRFYREAKHNTFTNPPSGSLIEDDVVSKKGREFYLYSNTSPHATARPLHYHVLLDGLGIERIQKLTYLMCFNFGKCSGTLSMPSSLRYAHNAAYDARNRVIEAREFDESKFYSCKFFC